MDFHSVHVLHCLYVREIWVGFLAENLSGRGAVIDDVQLR